MEVIKRTIKVVILTSTLISFSAMAGVRVEFVDLVNFSDCDQNKIHQAADLFERVINSEEFHNEILNFSYNGENEFVQNNGLTNEEVYQTILQGREGFNPVDDGVAQFYLRLYKPAFWKKWSVVGYTTPDTNFIHMNRNYFDIFELEDIASNMVHEWLHKLGFDHDFDRTARRPYSVPYGVGGIMEKIGKNLRLQ